MIIALITLESHCQDFTTLEITALDFGQAPALRNRNGHVRPSNRPNQAIARHVAIATGQSGD